MWVGAARVAKQLDDLAGILVRALDHGLLDRLEALAVLALLEEHARTSDLELIAFATHGFHKHRKMQDAAAGDLDAALVLELGDAHGHVVLALVEETLLELACADDIAIAPHERRRRSLEDDRERRGIDLDGIEMHGVLRIGVDVADIGAIDAHHGADVAGLDLIAFGTSQIVEGIQLANGGNGARSVVLHDKDLVAGVNGARIHATDADAAHIARVVDGHALHGERSVEIDLGSGHVLQNHVEQRIHVRVAILGVAAGIAVHRARIHHVLHGKLELLVGGAQVRHEVQAVVVGALGLGAGTVDLVDDDHDLETAVDGVAQHETRLGHGPLKGVDEQKGAVGHLEHALHLAAKVSVAGGVDDVDLHALVLNRAVLGENGDAALALLVIGVEDALLDLLVGAEGVRSPQQLVHQRGLAVVDVGDDGDVSQILCSHVVLLVPICPAVPRRVLAARSASLRSEVANGKNPPRPASAKATYAHKLRETPSWHIKNVQVTCKKGPIAQTLIIVNEN